jgi:hypothetical protein
VKTTTESHNGELETTITCDNCGEIIEKMFTDKRMKDLNKTYMNSLFLFNKYYLCCYCAKEIADLAKNCPKEEP